ncbi:hypothetical protein FDP41_002032 [Naegleria fowleri]|uniref:Uncharacterized protein n=1 Tax=Naegleria fowleri TaxID=5763 RepID=A0A6A5BWF0_NAEFO|nr:uncharacterized protein FDP41_002032 [Naegleria fowleri]KAF0978962.1 hypothetical protein FDP41_002032 [Naegleria fowleri]
MVAKTTIQHPNSSSLQGFNGSTTMAVEHSEMISGFVAGCSKSSLNKTRKLKSKGQYVLQLAPLVIDRRIKIEKMAVLLSSDKPSNLRLNEAQHQDEHSSLTQQETNSGSLYFVEDSLKPASSSDFDDFVIV